MYKQTQYDSWLIELSNYFIKEYGYQMITMSKDNTEIWMVNPLNKVNPIVMLSSLPISRFNAEAIGKHRESLAIVFKTMAEGINISVYPEKDYITEKNVVVGPLYKSNSLALSQFKNIETVLKESNNPDRALSKAVINLKRTVQQSQKKSFVKAFPVTNAISTICIVIFSIAVYLRMSGIDSTTTAVMLGAFYKRFILDAHEYWRFITAGFLHVDFVHIMMNLFALRNLGSMLEPVYGHKKFLAILLAGIIGGNAFVYIVDSGVVGLGLSGGLFALLGALLVYLIETQAIKNPKVLRQVVSILMINLFISLMPGVSMAAHIGGFQAGVFLGFVFSKRSSWSTLRKQVAVLGSIFAIAIIYIMTQKPYTTVDLALDNRVIDAWSQIGLKSYADRLLRLLF
ncbi:rhomboid family intramembrane serine protease [Erysipelothrix inopinata]|uniref:Rhomboid family intramembrane serine protease n=1 Tax=Erysipelothrix inopinata TaxID=225084 RepID=A0A7G9RWN9_9FIRM|nr:rhomboid family intramembrane serine protease [Erysipelothrix inopinata]QNN60014.1 rhomboid family intramembrane serine protease [Erysipelothrix inopinata]